MISRIDLNIPPEPIDIKNSIKERRRSLEKEGEKYHDYGEWVDSMAVWFGNILPSYLWRYWKDKLVGHGYTWQKFLRILRLHTSDIILWAIYDKLSWSDLVGRIIDSIEMYRR